MVGNREEGEGAGDRQGAKAGEKAGPHAVAGEALWFRSKKVSNLSVAYMCRGLDFSLFLHYHEYCCSLFS